MLHHYSPIQLKIKHLIVIDLALLVFVVGELWEQYFLFLDVVSAIFLQNLGLLEIVSLAGAEILYPLSIYWRGDKEAIM